MPLMTVRETFQFAVDQVSLVCLVLEAFALTCALGSQTNVPPSLHKTSTAELAEIHTNKV